MKRYFLFGFDNLYPSGGMGDFIEDFDSVENAIERIKKQINENSFPEYESDHYEVFDTKKNVRYHYDKEDESLCLY